jgi:hypothetical protein
MGIGAFLAATLGASVFSAVCLRARDVLSLMKWISSLSRPTPSPGYDSMLALWYVRIFGLVGALLGWAMSITAAVSLLRG